MSTASLRLNIEEMHVNYSQSDGRKHIRPGSNNERPIGPGSRLHTKLAPSMLYANSANDERFERRVFSAPSEMCIHVPNTRTSS